MRFITFSLVTIAVLIATPALAGDRDMSYGTDQTAIAKVRSTWDRAEALEKSGRYSAAIVSIRSGLRILPTMHDKHARDCYANSTNTQLAGAEAGAKSIRLHPGNLAAAEAAALAAMRAYPQMPNCG